MKFIEMSSTGGGNVLQGVKEGVSTRQCLRSLWESWVWRISPQKKDLEVIETLMVNEIRISW